MFKDLKTIFGKEYLDDMEYFRANSRVLFKVIAYQTVIIAFLVYGYLEQRGSVNFIMKMPPANGYSQRHIVYNLNGANVTYYELWGKYLTEKISNFDPNNISDKLDFAYREMRPTDKIKKVEELKSFSQFIIANKISQKFEMHDVEMSMDKKALARKTSVIITGTTHQKQGEKELKPKECKYQIDLKINEGVFYVEDFGTDCIS